MDFLSDVRQGASRSALLKQQEEAAVAMAYGAIERLKANGAWAAVEECRRRHACEAIQ